MEKALDLNDFNKEVTPSEDFNEYVNGNWMKNNPIPDKYTKWGSFEVLHEKNLERLKNIIEGSVYSGETINNCSDEYKKLKLLYDSYMNENLIEDLDAIPLDKYIKEIKSCETKSELWILLSKFYKYGLLSIFSFYPSEDAKNSNDVVPHLSTSGLGLPDRDYYFDEDKKETREKYVDYLESAWELYHMSKKDLTFVLDIETKLAEKTYTRVENRDPIKSYNKITINELKHICNLNWEKYFSFFIIHDISVIIVDNKEFYKRFYDLWNDLKLNVWKDYLIVKLISNLSSCLSDRFYMNKFNFYNMFLSGQKIPKPRWERAVSFVDSNLGELLGKTYVDKYFPQTSKDKMLELVNNLHGVLKERIINLTWMSEDTKIKALKKHKAFKFKIGYPDKWRDFSSLKFNDNDSLMNMIVKINIFDFEYEMNRLFKPTDLTRWEMNPHTINAYFHPLKNEIVFPAGILQKPFFDPDYDDAINYGAIGTVIGHEMTHSFDDMGNKFDEEGNLNNWWSDEDQNKFDIKSKYYVDEFNKLTVNGKNVNGKLTLGENLADHGGLKIAYYALNKHLKETKNIEKISNFSPNERFFISWGKVWKSNITPEEADQRIKTDPHSPNIWRINAALANIPEFHKTFNIQKNSKMYRENPVQMW